MFPSALRTDAGPLILKRSLTRFPCVNPAVSHIVNSTNKNTFPLPKLFSFTLRGNPLSANDSFGFDRDY
ncbi:hypothetical protein QTP88_022312 [Uroleucon formosanum]